MAGYRNNEQLKPAGMTENITKEEFQTRVQELIKCKSDIKYFANKYFYIINPEVGLHKINLYPKQEELLDYMVDRDRVVVLSSRQLGKCVSWKTLIKIRHKKLKIPIYIPIGLFYICINMKDTICRYIKKLFAYLPR